MTKALAILRYNLLWLALGLAATAFAAVVRVWGWKEEPWGSANALLGLLIVGMLVASWRLAHNDTALELQLDLKGRLLVIASVNIATLAVVLVTTMVATMLLYTDPEHRGMVVLLPLPFLCILTVVALVAARARRARA